MDISCGVVIDGELTIPEMGQRIFSRNPNSSRGEKRFRLVPRARIGSHCVAGRPEAAAGGLSFNDPEIER